MKNNNGSPKPSLLDRLTDKEVLPYVRSLIMLLIILKVISVQSLRMGENAFLRWVDYAATAGFVLALVLLALLFWAKYRGKPGTTAFSDSKENLPPKQKEGQ